MGKKKVKDKIPGGLADKSKAKFDPDQIQKGIKVEMEHTNDKSIAREIARDHLSEDPKYYDHLLEMEAKVKKTKAKKALEFSHIFWKTAQNAPDPELSTPNVKIQPGRPETNCALEILKRWKPDYFVGVREIVVGPSANYGHVQSGPDKDPAVIYINADRIVAESGGQQQGKAAALACAKVIAHEKGHVASFKPETGFQGGETPAEGQEQEFENWLNSGGMQQIQSLPCFQSLSGDVKNASLQSFASKGKLPKPTESELIAKIHKKCLGNIGPYKVWLVNGEVIRNKVDIDFLMGGNPGAYEYVPKDELWLEFNESSGDFAAILSHELVECYLIKKHGLSYTKAHAIAEKLERKIRDAVVKTQEPSKTHSLKDVKKIAAKLLQMAISMI